MSEIPIICGPTASGKTAIGIELAERAGGEIISMDSRQIYRRLDIGTAKATAEEQARARHHLIDVADPGERFTAADFVDRAKAAISDILGRGLLPIIVGGTPLYLSALIGGFDFCETDADPAFRESLREEASQHGSPALHDRLREADPESAERIHPNDLFRIVRALEILHVTGEKASRLRTRSVTAPGDGDGFRIFCVFTPREKLYERINKRVDFMYNMGLADETRSVLEFNTSARGFLRKIIGYAECVQLIEGETTEEEAASETKTRTRQFAKRQLTWLRALEGVTWLNSEKSEAAELAEFILKRGLN